jgi:DNA-binding FadR family transcriptional regulator
MSAEGGLLGDAILRRPSLADQVSDALLAMIVDGRVAVGEPLPPTGELADRYSVSRTVVREALADLAGRGIIERSQGREAVVSQPGPEQLQELLSFRLRRDSVEPAALIEFRQALELLSATKAATRVKAKDAAAAATVRTAFDQLAQAQGDVAFHEADIAFHRAVAHASGNALVELVLDAIVGLMRELRPKYFRGHAKRGRSLTVIVEEHRRITEAIEAGDSAGAAAAMTTHLAASARDLDAAD